jgi:hypothetical protein
MKEGGHRTWVSAARWASSLTGTCKSRHFIGGRGCKAQYRPVLGRRLLRGGALWGARAKKISGFFADKWWAPYAACVIRHPEPYMACIRWVHETRHRPAATGTCRCERRCLCAGGWGAETIAASHSNARTSICRFEHRSLLHRVSKYVPAGSYCEVPELL